MDEIYSRNRRNGMNTVHYSANNEDEWETPASIFDPLDAEFKFDLDPCATQENKKCQSFIDIHADGLITQWYRNGEFISAFVNPPFSKLKDWIARCAFESSLGMTCVMLIPARTDTRAWHTYIYDATHWRFRPGVEVRFLPGRVRFVGGAHCAPFPLCVVIFRPV